MPQARKNKPFTKREDSKGGDSKKKIYKGSKSFKFKPKKKKEDTKTTPLDSSIRLNRFLANSGICSRREADTLISSGAVSVNNEVVTKLGTKVSPDDTIHYGGELIQSQRKQYVLLNKPKNYITTMDDPKGRKTVMELVHRACKERIYPVGRLDRATTGLLLFTNDGQMTKRLTHPSGQVTKIYHVNLDKNVSQRHMIEMVEGIQLEDGFSQVDKVSYLPNSSKASISIELHSGRNRIIRRIMEHLGYKVTKLDRVNFAGLTKKDIPRGRFKQLSEQEIGLLHRVCGLQKK